MTTLIVIAIVSFVGGTIMGQFVSNKVSTTSYRLFRVLQIELQNNRETTRREHQTTRKVLRRKR